MPEHKETLSCVKAQKSLFSRSKGRCSPFSVRENNGYFFLPKSAGTSPHNSVSHLRIEMCE